ncbi:hypothetical protein G5C51_37745 [Streptomyces sp. A7024]|uniref:NB-ARC domain-containing protein n=1 Tax=Streptomyces coryli TaxID=1128680 RepID=A0A6G4UD66_9ACTN|nr:NB-ARC domain-containing protein [Streptomyces coryli]NGN69616.1 hypothetical protein [Streptomyces coryli]
MAGQLRVGNLPSRQTRIVGRGEELARLEPMCRQRPLVTVTGVGGVGKTCLALHAAAAAQPGFQDGVWWVELSGLHDGSLLAHVIAEALPLADHTTLPMIEVLGDYLAERKLLLVLDTCEHLTDACAFTVELLLRSAPGLRVLTTSRRPLGMLPEEVLQLEPLPVPQPGDASADAVVLLAERAAAVVPGFAVTEANRAELTRLCRRLEGLPLAIELAAARLREWPVKELAERLEDRFAALGNADSVVLGADPPWHQALRTAIGWSHQLCSPAERLLWARLSVFAGDFDAESARQVCVDTYLAVERIEGLLAGLVDKSIVTWAPTGGGERYHMLDTIREYGVGWLRRLGEEGELRRRHWRYYQAMACRAEAAWIGPDQIDWYDRMVAEHENLRAALDFCLDEQDGHSALDMGGTLWFFWYACGFAKEGQHYLDRAFELGTGPGPVRAMALWAQGVAAFGQGDKEASLRLAIAFREAVAGETDETAAVAAAFLEGGALTLNGRQEQAAEQLDRALATRPSGGRFRAAWVLAGIARGFAQVNLGRLAEAATVAEDVRAECSRHGETWVRAYGDYLRALAELGLGQVAEAAAGARAALDGKRRLHDSLGCALAIDLLASAAVAVGRAEQAARLLGISWRIWHTVGTPQMGSPHLIAARKACEDQARRLIGDGAYRTAFSIGYDTDPDAGIAYALDHAVGPHQHR